MYHTFKLNKYRALCSFLNVCKCECFKRSIHSVGLNDIPKITVSDIRKLLRQKGYAVQDGFTSIFTKCSLCQNEEKTKDAKVYINKTTGLYYSIITIMLLSITHFIG